MNMNESPIEVTVTIHFVLTMDPTEQYPLAAFAEFLTEQRLESTLLKEIIESLNDVLVEGFCGEKHAQGNGTNRFQRSTTKTRRAVTTIGEHEFSHGYVEDTAAAEHENAHFRRIDGSESETAILDGTNCNSQYKDREYQNARVTLAEDIEAASRSVLDVSVTLLGARLQIPWTLQKRSLTTQKSSVIPKTVL